MLQIPNQQYVCRQCLHSYFRTHTPLRLSRLDTFATRPTTSSVNPLSKRAISTKNDKPSKYGRVNIPNVPPKGVEQSEPPKRGRLLIRDELKIWAEAHASAVKSTYPSDPSHNTVTNDMIRPKSDVEIIEQWRDEHNRRLGLSDSSASDEETRIDAEIRRPGDLVELSIAASQSPMLAIYLGFIGGRNHFYTSNGRWIFSAGFSSIFTVPNYATPEQIQVLLQSITDPASPDIFEELRAADQGPSREQGAGLLQMMKKFRLDAERVYQEHLKELDGAHRLVASSESTRYLSLFEIADIVLSERLKYNDAFPPAALYAVHLALMRAESAFHPLGPSSYSHRRDHIFEVAPTSHADTIHRIATITREFSHERSEALKDLSFDRLNTTALGKFAAEARAVVTANRQAHSRHSPGALGSSANPTFDEKAWSQSSRDIIWFVELWASYKLFGRASALNAYGSLILRAVNLYDDSILDQGTAWMFLQEIGLIPSWEIQSRYKSRFPQTTIVRGGGLERESPGNVTESQREDVAADARRDWSDLEVWCIDGPGTVVVDDGVSLEKTSGSGEFWIHIHVADPASVIEPSSKLAKFLELIPETIYLPGHFQAMLPFGSGEDQGPGGSLQGIIHKFSMRSRSPVLTFSAKVDTAGTVLDYKVEPGIIQNVKYLEPDAVSRFCNEPVPPPAPLDSLSVGVKPASQLFEKPRRTITSPEDLEASSQDDMRTLYRLTEAVKSRRLQKGAWPYFSPRPSVDVEFHSTKIPAAAEAEHRELVPDPFIQVGYKPSSGCALVSTSMVLAGEIAARWCSSRNIPVPYRRDAALGQNLEEALRYATTDVYPLIEQGIEPARTQREQLTMLTGPVELASQPGPYFLLGLDMYAKVTSPLRRFADLIAHWQIHAALAFERRTGRSIDPAADALDDILPFTTERLDETLPLLDKREKMCRTTGRGSKDWILQALDRAWRVEKTAPESFKFTVDICQSQALYGHMDYFGLDAEIDVDGLDDVVLIRNVKVGDTFEVELESINTGSGIIKTKARRRLGDNLRGIDGQVL